MPTTWTDVTGVTTAWTTPSGPTTVTYNSLTTGGFGQNEFGDSDRTISIHRKGFGDPTTKWTDA